jgi:hypothetical protein
VSIVEWTVAFFGERRIMTQHPDLFAALAAPFDVEEIKLRAQAGRQLPYVTARTFMNRLDDVLGPENWWDDFVPLEHSVICRLTIRLPDGTVITKCDAGGHAGLADPGDDDKSGFADAFKRAAVKFGVGRYLYRDGVPKYAREAPKSTPVRDPEPVEAVLPPVFVRPPANSPAPVRASDEGTAPPRSGRALFAWIRDQDERHDYGLLKDVSAWAKRQGFPARMVDWDLAQVARAFAEAHRKIQSPPAMKNDVEAVLSN